MESVTLGQVDNIISASRDTMPKPADTAVPSIAMRILQKGAGELRPILETLSPKSRLILAIVVISIASLAKKFANRAVVITLHNIQDRLPGVSPLSFPFLPSLSSILSKTSKRLRSEDAPTATSTTMEPNQVALQRHRDRNNSGINQPNSNKAPNPKAATNNPGFLGHWGHKDKEQADNCPYHNEVHGATGRAVQVVTGVNHGGIYNGNSGMELVWAIIGISVAAMIVLALIRG
ncbi:hypothetical protein F5X99DRAFT_376579 [Biscogniauxia marginata]|nr:hypothetical protein F5X99DRAFT_376579 [Biscogniauxia marginata]